VAAWLEAHHHQHGRVAGMRFCLSHPGDVLYIPAGWHHATINYGPAVLAVAAQPHLAFQPALVYLNAFGQLLAQGDLDAAEQVLQALQTHRHALPPAEVDMAQVHFYAAVASRTNDTGKALPGHSALHGIGAAPRDALPCGQSWLGSWKGAGLLSFRSGTPVPSWPWAATRPSICGVLPGPMTHATRFGKAGKMVSRILDSRF
jgi:hypothetical protein